MPQIELNMSSQEDVNPNQEVTSREHKISWLNTWDEIYRTSGIPEDLRHPYGRFDFIAYQIIQAGAKNVLDVAMGPGRHSIELAKMGLKVYGFDLSIAALELAKQELQANQVESEMRVADMFDILPYPDNFFDSVVAIQAIYHGLPHDMQFAIDEIHRVLKPGGVFGFTVSMDCERPRVEQVGSTLVTRSSLSDSDFIEVPGHEDTYIYKVGREAGIPHYYPGEKKLQEMLSGKFNHILHFSDMERRYRLVTCIANGGS